MATRAYTVTISADDSVTTTVAGGSPVVGIAADRQTQAFFGYLSAFAPIATLAAGTCSKSPSTATTTIVTYLSST